jgi:hypothetical protein
MLMTDPTLFPPKRIPYLIVAPPYTAMSAGVRVMHALCHALNMIGERAYLTTYPQIVFDRRDGAYTCPDLCTPLMTTPVLRAFEAEGRSPIVVYLEAVRHNPLNATRIARYALNYPGLLGGDAVFPEGEMRYAYSRRIAKRMGIGEERVLFMPASDPAIFYPPPAGAKREGACFYAAKYQDIHHGALFPVTKGAFEITRFRPDSLSKPEIAALFRRSERFYAYEDTALAIEAGLCGCPTVFLKNDYLREPLGFDDLGMDGFAWGDAPEEIARAKASVHRFPENYAAVTARFWAHLRLFADQTQQEAQAKGTVGQAITLPASQPFHTVRYAMEYVRQYGIRRFFAKTAGFLRKSGPLALLRHTLRNLMGGR